MRLHRFFIDEPLRNKKDTSLFDDEIIHQLKDVFRMHAGNKLILLDNSGFEYLSEISLISKSKIDIKIIDSSVSENIPTKEVWLFAALIKKDNFEWILEKCTELGVSHIVPILSDRTEKKELNTERALKIIKEASEQSGRGILPVLHEVIDLKQCLREYRNEDSAFFVCDTDTHAQKVTKEFLTRDSIGIFIGPEGGWSDNEKALFTDNNLPQITFGNQILRAETAAIVAVTLVTITTSFST